MNKLYKNLEELISIPSITYSKEEIDIFNYMDVLLRSILSGSYNFSGVEVNIEKIENVDEFGVFHGGIICNINIGNEYNTVGLLGHLDVVTVQEDQWTKSPFTMTEEDDRIYGRGACDMKAGVSIMIEILKKSLKEKPNKNISLIFTTGEETGIYNGLTEIIKSQKLGGLDFVIALEPTGGKINVGVFGYIDGEFVFKGRSCHSSNPSKGENAIHKTSALLEYLKNPTILKSVNYFGEKLQEVLIASNISGGVARNVVPDSCSVTINHRYLPGKKIEDVEDSFLTLATEIGADSFKILCHDPSSKIVEVSNPMLLDFIKKIRGNVSMLSVVPFWSDIGQTSYKGIPSINFGPGNIAQAHTADEFLLKKDFEKTFNQFINYLFN